ncbi:MAG: response regulator transcription factor [Ignavibacteria bacterium]|jgi:DNA-binding NarL/FixJ family response regulator
MAESKRKKIIIADDHEMVRVGLKMTLEEYQEFEIIAEGEDGADAINLCMEHKPDLLLIDLKMPGIDGIEASLKIKSALPNIKILMLTAHDSKEVISQAVLAGIDGYMIKTAPSEEIILAIKMLFKGVNYYPGNNQIVDIQNERKLTCREIEILKLISKGYSSTQIGEKLFLSKYTILNHRKNIIRKLNLRNTTEAVLYASSNGLI